MLLAALAMLVASGCGGMRHPDAGVPRDFSVGVTVLGSTDATDQPRPLRPGQYLLEGDNVLRVAVGAGVTPDTYPHRLRRISGRQRERVWSLVEAGGIHDQSHPGRIGDVRAFRPVPRDGWAIFDVSARGERRAIAVRLDEDAGARALVDELAGLAWIRP